MSAVSATTPGATAMTNLATNLVTTAGKHPDRTAIKLDALELTWSQFRDRALAMAGAMRAAGLQPGDRVALILPNVPAYPVLFYGALMAGEIEYYFTDSGATFAFVWGDFVEEATKGAANPGTQVVPCGPLGPVEGAFASGEPLTDALERDDEDTAVILYN